MNMVHSPMLPMWEREMRPNEMFDWLSSIPQNTIYANYYPFMDKDYNDEGFLDGKYTLGPFADLDKMNQLFSYFRANWNWDPYHENIMHHFQ